MQFAELAGAYVRREQWRAQLVAMELGRLLMGSAKNDGGTQSGVVVGNSGKTYRKVSASGMLALLGTRVVSTG